MAAPWIPDRKEVGHLASLHQRPNVSHCSQTFTYIYIFIYLHVYSLLHVMFSSLRDLQWPGHEIHEIAILLHHTFIPFPTYKHIYFVIYINTDTTRTLSIIRSCLNVSIRPMTYLPYTLECAKKASWHPAKKFPKEAPSFS